MSSFQEKFHDIFTFDIIRMCKIIEIIQYSFIYIVLITICAFILNKYYFNKIHLIPLKPKQSLYDIIKYLLKFWLDVVIFIIIIFYFKKIGLLFPSIPSLFYKKFIPNTTLELTVHMAIIVFFMELLPIFKKHIRVFNSILAKDEHIHLTPIK